MGAEIMLEQVNQKADILPGYELKIVWQDGLCDGMRAADVFLRNVFKQSFEVFAPGVPVEELNSDGVGEIRTEDVEKFTQIWTLANSSAPVGMLGCGCSGETKAITNIAYNANYPIVSGASTFPGLSNRRLYPNFWRTILPDTNFPAAWITMAQMFGFSRTTVIIGETEVWKGMAEVVVATAQEKGMQLDGVDLSDELSAGFKGYQVSLDSESAASEAAKGLREQRNRVVINLMYEKRNRILFCECHKLGLDNFVWMVMGWLPGGWWRKADTDCPLETVTWMAWGFVSANMQFWRSDIDQPLSCSQGMTAAGFQAEWLSRQGISLDQLTEMTPEGFLPALESSTVADAVCMYVQMLHAMLQRHGFSLQDLQERKPPTYEKVQEELAAVDFEGVTGRIQYKPGVADPEGAILMQHLQSFTDRFVDIASYGSDGSLNFLGLSNLTFKMPGETYFAGPMGATRLEATIASFTACESGQTLNYTSNLCQSCADSQEFVSSMGFCACRSGYANSDGVCVECLAGKFSSSTGSTVCESCPVGRFSSSDRETVCARCESGKYQDEVGRSTCESCPATFTTNGEGGESVADCWCGPGTRLDDASGLCEDCGDEEVTGLLCLGGDDVQVAEGFFAADDTFSIFKCYGNIPGRSRCPGGVPPDVCAAGREGLSCSACMEGMKEHSSAGSCIPCEEGTPGYAALVGALVGFACMLAALYVGIDRRGATAQSHSMLLFALVFSLVVTITQQLGILAMFTKVEFPNPFRSLLDGLTIMTFDVDVLNLNCIAKTSALSNFIAKVCILGMCVVMLLLVHVIVVLVLHQGKFRERNPSLVGSVGTIFMVFYISVISTVLGPLQCVQHPNGVWTARAYHSVICWETADHTAMVAIGMAALLVPLAYLAKCAQCVWQFPAKMRQGDINFLQTFYFLFFRYKAEAYWYCLVHIMRSMVLANLPIIPNVSAQLLGMQAVLVSQFYCVIAYRPWRVPSTNTIDLFFTVAMMFVIAASSFYVDQTPGVIIAWFALVAILLTFLFLPLSLGYALYHSFCVKKRKEFQFFVCHHKAGAGSFARLMKIVLQQTSGVTRKVFIDCDNLTDLDVLFDHVANMTEMLVIVSSKELFLRLWCMGEVVTAMTHDLNAVRVGLPDFEEPTEEFIQDYESHAGDLSILTNRGISLEETRAALRWSLTLNMINVSLDLNDESMEAIARSVVSRRACNTSELKSSQGAFSKTLIIRDETNLEATAAGMVLAHKMHRHFSHAPDTIPRMLPFGEAVPKSTSHVLLLCSPGALEQPGMLRTLHSASACGARCLPVVVDEGFRFPTATFHDDHLELVEKVCGDAQAAALLVDDIQDIFKTIAPAFPANMASEVVLNTKSAEIAERLLSWARNAQDGGAVSWKKTSSSVGSGVLCSQDTSKPFVQKSHEDVEPQSQSCSKAGGSSFFHDLDAADSDGQGHGSPPSAGFHSITMPGPKKRRVLAV